MTSNGSLFLGLFWGWGRLAFGFWFKKRFGEWFGVATAGCSCEAKSEKEECAIWFHLWQGIVGFHTGTAWVQH